MMTRIGLAIRVFFRVLRSATSAEQVGRLLNTPSEFDPAATVVARDRPGESPKKQQVSHTPGRSDALSLLSALQREGRFVDFIKEPIDGYSDAQIGAAVRDVHRDCGAVIERVFSVRPLVEDQEASEVKVPGGFEAMRYRLVGKVQGEPPYYGKLCHHGWQATRVELPQWTGSQAAAMILSPAEVELA